MNIFRTCTYIPLFYSGINVIKNKIQYNVDDVAQILRRGLVLINNGANIVKKNTVSCCRGLGCFLSFSFPLSSLFGGWRLPILANHELGGGETNSKTAKSVVLLLTVLLFMGRRNTEGWG